MTIQAVVLYGSWARGDQTPSSDIDLLLVGGNSTPRHGLMGSVSLSTYCDADLARRAQDGDLFTWHVLFEGRPLYDPDRILQRYRDRFQLRSSYSREQRQGSAVAWMLARFPDAFAGSSITCRRTAWAVRTILIARAAERGRPVFSTAVLSESAPIPEARRLILQKDQPLPQAGLIEDLISFLRWSELPDPAPQADTPQGYAAVFVRDANGVGLGLLDRWTYDGVAGPYGQG